MKQLILVLSVLAGSTSILCSQPRIDPTVAGKTVVGEHRLRLKPKVGETFHYRVNIKSQVSIKNDDDLLIDEMPGLKANDKAVYSIAYFISVSVRAIRNDNAAEFLLKIDSIHNTIDDNGSVRSFTTTHSGDSQDSAFEEKARYAGYDFGITVDTLGNFKDIYGFYNISDMLFSKLDDSLQTTENANAMSDEVYSGIRKIARYLFSYLPEIAIDKETPPSKNSTKENYSVWSTLQFPMQKDYTETVTGFEEREGKTFAVISGETTLTPVERVLEETEYHTTLPNFTLLNKDLYYLDTFSGMLAYDKWTEDESYSMKIESKLPEKSGKSFATVHRSKVETVVELLK